MNVKEFTNTLNILNAGLNHYSEMDNQSGLWSIIIKSDYYSLKLNRFTLDDFNELKSNLYKYLHNPNGYDLYNRTWLSISDNASVSHVGSCLESKLKHILEKLKQLNQPNY